MSDIRSFLDKNPSLADIQDFVDSEAARIVSELKSKEKIDRKHE